MSKQELKEKIEALEKELDTCKILRGSAESELKLLRADADGLHTIFDGTVGVVAREIQDRNGWSKIETNLSTRFASFLQTLIPASQTKEVKDV